MRIGFSTLLLGACAVFAQDQSQPAAPPEVDTALRSRVSQFYQAHVDGKYRIADQVVAEDSKDYFFAATKPRYLGFEIIRINYSDEFKRAQVIVSCDSDWYVRGAKMKVKLPSTSNWKVVDGQWFWYATPVNEVKTPFGTMNYDAASGGAKAAGPVPALPGDPQVLAQQILQQVRTDKSEVTLSSYQPATADVKVMNGLQGSISLRTDIDGRFPGLSVKLDKTEVKAGDSATLTVICEPKDRVAKPALTVRIYVEPTGQILPVRLVFAIPPELDKLIPKEAKPQHPTP